MKEYHKIQTVFKRDMTSPKKTLMTGQWTTPEFEYLQHANWTWSEKVDGTNIRIMWDGERVTFGGKTDNASIPAKLIERLRERFPDGAAFKSAFDCGDVCLYGEGYGAGIQNGGAYRPDQDFVLFDVKVGRWWLQREDVEDVGRKLGLDVVPMLGAGSLNDCIAYVREGFQSEWGVFLAEGIVLRPMTELLTRGGERIIAKLKTKDFAV